MVSNATRTVSSGQIFLRRGIGASVGHLPEIGLPTKIQRKLAATLPVARPKRPVLKDHRPLEPICGNIVGAALARLVGALLLEQNDEWAVARRYMTLETLAETGDTAPISLPAIPA